MQQSVLACYVKVITPRLVIHLVSVAMQVGGYYYVTDHQTGMLPIILCQWGLQVIRTSIAFFLLSVERATCDSHTK